jgi:uncharacterized protein YjbI with pentapeptide repeats
MSTSPTPGDEIRRLRISKLELEIEQLQRQLSSSAPPPDPEQHLRASKLEREIQYLDKQLAPATLPSDPDEALLHSKLELEIRQLKDQTSRSNNLLEWVKAGATPIAVIALIWTMFVGYRQIRDNTETRDEERFDKAVSRLGSSNSSERLTGVAGLGLFLTERQKGRHVATLTFMTGAIAAEKDPIVRGSLLELLDHLDPNVVSQDARDQGLRSLIDKNRTLVLNASSPVAATAAPWKRGEELRFHELSDSDKALLDATATAITLFVGKGTRILDFSGIYCVGCIFSIPRGILDLAQSHFDRALLRDANFTQTNLHGASFDAADLIGSKFIRSNLEGALFTDSSEPPDESYVIRYSIVTGKQAKSPDFGCADLTQADFSGSSFFGLTEGSDDRDLRATSPNLEKANLTSTNFSRIRLFSLHRHDTNGASNSAQSDSIPLVADKIILKRALPPQSTYKLVVIADESWKIREPLGIRFKNSLEVLMRNFESGEHLDRATLPKALDRWKNKYTALSTNVDPCQK